AGEGSIVGRGTICLRFAGKKSTRRWAKMTRRWNTSSALPSRGPAGDYAGPSTRSVWSVCPAFAAAKTWHKVRPGNSIAIQSVLYNHLSDVLPLFRLWQVQVEPVALALGHVHQEGIDLNSNSCELYAVGVVERSLVAEGNLGTQVAFVLQH